MTGVYTQEAIIQRKIHVIHIIITKFSLIELSSVDFSRVQSSSVEFSLIEYMGQYPPREGQDPGVFYPIEHIYMMIIICDI